MRILILGGTGEALELAEALVARRHRVTYSLAGHTAAPRQPPKARLHLGHFGGVDGLIKYLAANRIDYLIDATHPFAAEMSAHAVEAGAQTGVPLLRLDRPAWPEPSRSPWQHAKSEEDAATLLPASATVLLTTGRRYLEPFIARSDCRFVLRALEAPGEALPANFVLHIERPPFTLPEELALLKHFSISHLVAKNSGGPQAAAKLDAAYLLKVHIVMIDRPVLPAAPSVATVAEALETIDHAPAPARRFPFLP